MLDESGHDTTSSLDTEGKGGNVKKILSLLRGVAAKENGGLECGTIGDSLIRVDALVGLLAVKEVGNDMRDTSGIADQDDFMNVRLVNLGVPEDLLDRVESAT